MASCPGQKTTVKHSAYILSKIRMKNMKKLEKKTQTSPMDLKIW